MSEIEIDQLIESTRVDGSGAEVAPPALAPLAAWSEVDPDYAEFATDDSDPDEDEDADDLTQEELDAPEPDGDAATVIEPVGIELWGQNLDEGTEWVKVAEQDLDGDGEAGIAMIPSVPTATNMRYRLRLVYSDGSFSKWSEQQEVTTPRDTTPPPVPSAPWVHTQYGHTQAGWDGVLAADSPIDFDHTRLYVQQMEPETGVEPPEGGYVTGDPQLVTRFSSEGSHMLGFLPEAEHRAFLTSVDTSGNESARSEYTTFTPTPPVDTDRIREELDQAREEREQFADEFEERTDEYDRLMAEQEDALDETDSRSHDALYRADQAAAEAAAARDTAERAEDNAAIARETADGSVELQAITEPGGTGSHGQRWVQYDHMGRDRKILGVWTWNAEDQTWDAISHDVTYLPMADITQATIGDLQTQRLFAERGEVDSLLVGRGENLVNDPMFDRIGTGGWRDDAQGLWQRAETSRGPAAQLTPTGIRSISGDSRLGQDDYFPASPGERYGLSGRAWIGDDDTELNVCLNFFESRGGGYLGRRWFGSSRWSGRAWRDLDGIVEVPDLANGATVWVGLQFFVYANPDAAGSVSVLPPRLTRVQSGELIVDGITRSTEAVINQLFTDTTVATSVWSQIVRTRLLEAEEALIGGALIKDDAITVDKIAVTDELIFEIAQGISLEVDQLASNDIVGMNIRGGLIEGVQMVGSEVMTSEDWETSGGAIMRQDGAEGNIVTVDSEGNTTARLGGDRNEVSNLDIMGALRVGDGEGALVPDEGRLRIQGRLPLEEAGARDTFTYGFSPLFTINNPTSSHYEEWDVVYEEPAPSNQRGVFLQVMQYTQNSSTITATTPSISASGFTARIAVFANSGTNNRVQLRYFSVWR